MSCFSHFRDLPTIVGYAMRRGGGQEKTHQIMGGGFEKLQGKRSKITIAPPLHKL